MEKRKNGEVSLNALAIVIARANAPDLLNSMALYFAPNWWSMLEACGKQPSALGKTVCRCSAGNLRATSFLEIVVHTMFAKPRAKPAVAPPRKKRKSASTIDEIAFDPSAREAYLSGFHKRKLQRIKHAKEEAAKRYRDERLTARKIVRLAVLAVTTNLNRLDLATRRSKSRPRKACGSRELFAQGTSRGYLRPK